MKRPATILVVLVSLVAVSFGALNLIQTGADMTTAADKFLKLLTDQQRGQAVLAYDAPTRTDWHYIPKPTRKGLQARDMTDAQRAAAHELLRSALSAVGYDKATKIMDLEKLLHELEKNKQGSPLRDPLRYYFTIFGQPAADGKWGLSVEGHHLSLNFVVDHNRVASSTPTFFGANPATLMADYGGKFKKGLRTLAQEEQLAFDLLASLTAEQRKKAVIADKAPKDVRGAGEASPPAAQAVGLPGSEMTAPQRALLRSLLEEYANNLPPDVAQARLSAVEKEGYDGIYFAWSGADKPGIGHDYRVQGTTFLIEFNNTQPDASGNVANHIHSVWHDAAGNFALPVKSK